MKFMKNAEAAEREKLKAAARLAQDMEDDESIEEKPKAKAFSSAGKFAKGAGLEEAELSTAAIEQAAREIFERQKKQAE
jgi:U3 small nucleolar RNA-associated protein 14